MLGLGAYEDDDVVSLRLQTGGGGQRSEDAVLSFGDEGTLFGIRPSSGIPQSSSFPRHMSAGNDPAIASADVLLFALRPLGFLQRSGRRGEGRSRKELGEQNRR